MPASDPEDSPPDQPTVDELFDAMSEETRRRALYYLRERGTTDVDGLREHLAERTTADTAEMSVILYHKTLPKLDDLGVIDYDQHSEQVRYEGGPLATELLELVGDEERNGS